MPLGKMTGSSWLIFQIQMDVLSNKDVEVPCSGTIYAAR
jgi:hypothetical protein